MPTTPFPPKPCSQRSTLLIQAALELQTVSTGPKGRVITIPAPPDKSLGVTVDYVHHQVTITSSPRELVLLIADGIEIERTGDGLLLSVPKDFNVIPVFDPTHGEIGYFKAPVPPDNPVNPHPDPDV